MPAIGDLHPGCAIAIARLSMDELGVARAIASNQLISPQRYHNVWLFDIRITGTGHAYRSGLKEHVWRDASIYLNEEFLARCNGLPVIWEHPKKATLDSEEYADRSIGTILLPYIKGDEVWGIAKIYDDGAAEEMAEGGLSTSPGVVLQEVGNTKMKMEDGTVLLIEGKPALLDHIAVCGLGVWDKGGEPSGVRTDNELVRIDSMPDDNKLDQLLGLVTGLVTKVDAQATEISSIKAEQQARKDAEDEKEKDEKAREDKRKADRQARRDAEHAEFKKMDEAMCDSDDADEEADCAEMKKRGDADEEAEDKARENRKDRMDKRKADAEMEAKKITDAEDEKKKADAARADSFTDDQRKRLIAIVERKLPTAEDISKMLSLQADLNGTFNMHGEQAPAYMDAEFPQAYRVRVLGLLQRHSDRWKNINLAAILRADEAGFETIEKDIRADAVAAARNPRDLPDDRLITVPMKDPVTGLTSYEFRGKRSFIHALKRPASRVTGVNTESRRSH